MDDLFSKSVLRHYPSDSYLQKVWAHVCQLFLAIAGKSATVSSAGWRQDMPPCRDCGDKTMEMFWQNEIPRCDACFRAHVSRSKQRVFERGTEFVSERSLYDRG